MKQITASQLGTRYQVKRDDGKVILLRVVAGASTLIEPGPSLKLWNHSSGFEFGYCGSGPAQLALGILFDFLRDKELALSLYQDFKRTFVAAWQDDHAEVAGKQIVEFIAAVAMQKDAAAAMQKDEAAIV